MAFAIMSLFYKKASGLTFEATNLHRRHMPNSAWWQAEIPQRSSKSCSQAPSKAPGLMRLTVKTYQYVFPQPFDLACCE